MYMSHSRIIYSAILLLTMFSVSLPSAAQIGKPRKEFAVGGSAGAVHSNISFVPSIRQQFNLGKTFGATVRYTSEKFFFLICGAQMEVNYVDRGWKELIEDGSENEYRRSLSYIEIPFYAHLGIGREARGAQGFLNIGPQIGFLLNSTEHYGGKEPWDISHRPNNVIEQYGKDIERKFEYGISGGLGVEFKTGAGNFILEGRYYFGLSDIFNNSKKDFFARSANNTIYLKVAYMIDLTR